MRKKRLSSLPAVITLTVQSSLRAPKILRFSAVFYIYHSLQAGKNVKKPEIARVRPIIAPTTAYCTVRVLYQSLLITSKPCRNNPRANQGRTASQPRQSFLTAVVDPQPNSDQGPRILTRDVKARSRSPDNAHATQCFSHFPSFISSDDKHI